MEFESKFFLNFHSSFFVKWSRIGPCFFSFIFVSILVLVYYERGLQCPQLRSEPEPEPEKVKQLSGYEMSRFGLSEANGSCDLFSGKWIWDNVTHPLYDEEDCPYIDSQLSCRANGRPDNSYQFWRWQPHGCDLPRFNASLILESIRGKKMMFVGDSLNRGQFFSMICLVQSVIPEGEKSLEQHDSLVTFRATKYNATIEYYWAPFLLESNSDDIFGHKSSEKIVRKNSIEKHGVHWRGADVMIFNTYAWWLWDVKIIEGSFDDESKNLTKLSVEEGYRLGIESVIEWINKNMDSNKTRVFFTSMSPNHAISGEWGANDGGNCYNETTIIDEKTYWGTDCRKSMMQVIKDEFMKSEYPITLLNITQLSSYRKDAHVSIYKKHWTPLTPEQVADPVGYADCLHFCLPGLQDTWNELLFTKLFYS